MQARGRAFKSCTELLRHVQNKVGLRSSMTAAGAAAAATTTTTTVVAAPLSAPPAANARPAAAQGEAAPGEAAAAAASVSRSPLERDFLVYRWDCGQAPGVPEYQLFTVDINSCGPMVVDVLLKIRQELDPSLIVQVGCRCGRCGACACNIDGKNKLACQTMVDPARSTVMNIKGLVPPVVPCEAY